jgi:tetratricopeptide (TPR) repeat protein
MTAAESQKLSENSNKQWTVLIVCIFLAVAVFAVFGRTIRYDFVNYDDEDYFFGNPHVETGLSWHNAAWAFQIGYAANWHPLTWLSLMLDAQLFGRGAAGPHFTNVLLHAANSILLFLLLRRLTGALWPCALVAALFAIHPVHVESVAWISERKDVLSGFFFLLTLGAYARYMEETHIAGLRSRFHYGLALVLFACGLMSKPMLVTLPMVLLVLDYWPLQRLTPGLFLRRVVEKLPFFALSAISCFMTLWAQKTAIAQIAALSLGARIGNAMLSGCIYLRQLFVPTSLAAFYPYQQNDFFPWECALAFLFLASITVGVIVLRKRVPYLLAGWSWYLGMLVPVIGLVQVGGQAHADRYFYLPLIGIAIMMAWAAKDLAAWRHQCRPIFWAVALGGLAALLICAGIQTTYWRNSETLWRHALACTVGNYEANSDLGNALYGQGRVVEAIGYFETALAINPNCMGAHNNLGIALVKQGRVAEAISHYQRALEIRPNNAEVHINLGNALATEGKTEEAIEHFKEAIRLNPGRAEAYNDWGAVLLAHGRNDEAVEQFQKAVQVDPNYAEVENNLGSALAEQRQITEAVAHYRKAIQIKPDYANAHYNLANVLAAEGQLDEAVEHYQRAVELMPAYNHARYQLAVLLGSRGKWADAVMEFKKILELDPKHVPALNNLAWLLATCPDASIRNGSEAVALAKQSLQFAGGNHPEVLDTLAAAYAEGGDFDEAVTTAESAKNRALNQNSPALAEAIQTRITLYENKTAFRDSVAPASKQ